MTDWVAIKSEYITTDIGLRELADKHGIVKSTLFARSSKERWPEQREQHKSGIVAKALSKHSSAKAKTMSKVQGTADKLLDKIAAMAEREDMEARDLKALVSALKDIKDIKGERSALDLKEQEARIKALEQKGGDTASSVTVEIGEASEYAQ